MLSIINKGFVKNFKVKSIKINRFASTTTTTNDNKSDITVNKGSNGLDYNSSRFSSPSLPSIFAPFASSPFLDDFFKPFATPTLFGQMQCSQALPKISACESDKEFHIEAEVPGIDKKNIQLKVVNDILSIQAIKKTNHHSKHEDKNVIWHFEEHSSGKMRRSFKLPDNIKSDEIKAKLLDGILSITIPKEEHHHDQEEHHAKKKIVHID